MDGDLGGICDNVVLDLRYEIALQCLRIGVKSPREQVVC